MVGLVNFTPHLFFSSSVGIVFGDLFKRFLSMFVIEDGNSLFAIFHSPGLELGSSKLLSGCFLESLLVLFDVFDVTILHLNVKEFEPEGSVGIFGRGSFSSVEVEHHIEFLGSVDVPQEADEGFEERDFSGTIRSLEMVVNSGVVLDRDSLSQGLEGTLVVDGISLLLSGFN